MYACASCLEARDVRLFDVRVDGQAIRTWWCPECAFVERRRGLEVEPAPAWIERAALRQLPVKELPDPERPSLQLSFGLFGRSTDRRRGDRRRQRVATR